MTTETLQWGRDPRAADSLPAADKPGPGGLASMGPRPKGRG